MSSYDREDSREIRSEPLAYGRNTLEFTVEKYSLDDDEGSHDVGNDDPVSLDRWAGEWDTLTLEGTLEIREDLGSWVFPPAERDDPPGEIVLATECDPTHLRRGRSVSVDDLSEGSHDVSLTVESDDYYGVFTVRPLLIRTSPGRESDEYRTVPGVALADGPETTVVIDEEEDDADVLLPSQFKSFGDSDSDEYPDDALYVVQRADPDRPKLFVNSDYDDVRTALTSSGHGYLGRSRDVFRDSILLPAYLDLILWTAENADERGDVQYDWQEVVLEEFVTGMYDTDDRSEAARQLHEHFHGDGSVNELMDAASVTLQGEFDVDESMTKLVRRLER